MQFRRYSESVSRTWRGETGLSIARGAAVSPIGAVYVAYEFFPPPTADAYQFPSDAGPRNVISASGGGWWSSLGERYLS
jgi:hypothetical protein